ncbi:hypothetical protein ABE583_15665 [Stenotrophomonas sp. TWI143]|uniref:hypothetical protein n=1 Tax=Stenotrophomonas TaxID=40323 RepID=UPI0018D27E3D|nr:hypothetical protein [Stenotrophomonas maltophilia]MBH1834622.1 hypothetical protein [Stenotrophomonas maltophilia]MCU1022182.1 hypothetical protein [Stenotrophomonas maltophilia]HDS1217641.1 hypothetical protein [Stenotrophomonas maltophilia]HDS1231836.1 hypothetical protein [Stenotrophomonas maltophilia]HEL5052882.1 hypothetical protein [Stenotrophomonas maltophilia]
MAPIAPSLAGLQQMQVRRNGAGKSTAISGLLRLRRPGGGQRTRPAGPCWRARACAGSAELA